MSNNDSQKKQTIKQAARDLFSHFGYAKTSMMDIAKQSNLSKPAIYYYYKNKEALFNEIIIEDADEFLTQIERKLSSVKNVEDRLRKFIFMLYKGLKNYARDFENVPEILCDHSIHGKQIGIKIQDMLNEKLLPVIDSGVKQGIFRSGRTKEVVASIINMTGFINIEWIRNQNEKHADKIVTTSIDLIVNGLKGSPDNANN